MPHACPVCSNEDYDEDDGLFFCTECGTQSQELIVQEAAVNTDINVRHEVQSSRPEGQSASQKPRAALGRPWTIYEAYQIIILNQAESLISLGAKQELKDVVFTVWANYLSKLGIAFCTPEKLVPDIVTQTRVGRLRELHRGTLDNPLNRHRRRFKEEGGRSVQGSGMVTDAVSGEEFYQEDEPVDEACNNIIFIDESDDSDVNDDSSSEEDRARARRQESRKTRAYRSPEWMNMMKTLAICYIGLMFTNPEILPCDVLRWVYEGKVTFLSASHLLPSDMVLSAGDQALFEIGRFDTSIFIKEISKLMTYLKLERLPSPDLHDLICRFLKELSLPGEFAAFSHRLVMKIPFLWKNPKTHYRKVEMLALSYIILTLKLVLHLDDSTEWLVSEFSEKLQSLTKPEKKLFIWRDWKKLMIQKCSEEFNAYRKLTCDISKSKLWHLDQLLKCHADTESDKKRLTTRYTLNSHKRLLRRHQPEFRASLKKPLDIALERMSSTQTSDHEFGCSRKAEWAREGEEFQNSTVCHIIDFSLFEKQLGNISSMKRAKLEKLKQKYPISTGSIFQYNVVKDFESLSQHRHESYLWLLYLTSQMVDCSALLIDNLVVRLTDYLVTLSSGADMSGVLCSVSGSIQTGKTSAYLRD